MYEVYDAFEFAEKYWKYVAQIKRNFGDNKKALKALNNLGTPGILQALSIDVNGVVNTVAIDVNELYSSRMYKKSMSRLGRTYRVLKTSNSDGNKLNVTASKFLNQKSYGTVYIIDHVGRDFSEDTVLKLKQEIIDCKKSYEHVLNAYHRCIFCGGTMYSDLTTDCFGSTLTKYEWTEIRFGRLDFREGKWYTNIKSQNIVQSVDGFKHNEREWQVVKNDTRMGNTKAKSNQIRKTQKVR